MLTNSPAPTAAIILQTIFTIIQRRLQKLRLFSSHFVNGWKGVWGRRAGCTGAMVCSAHVDAGQRFRGGEKLTLCSDGSRHDQAVNSFEPGDVIRYRRGGKRSALHLSVILPRLPCGAERLRGFGRSGRGRPAWPKNRLPSLCLAVEGHTDPLTAPHNPDPGSVWALASGHKARV